MTSSEQLDIGYVGSETPWYTVGTVVATVVGRVVGTVVLTVVGTVVLTVVGTVVGTVVLTVVGLDVWEGVTDDVVGDPDKDFSITTSR